MTPYRKCKQDAARVCREIAERAWYAYKNGVIGHSHYRGNPEIQGQSTGAEECEQAILALPEPRGWKDEEILNVWHKHVCTEPELDKEIIAFARSLLGGGK